MARRRDPELKRRILDRMKTTSGLIERFHSTENSVERDQLRAEIESRLSVEAMLLRRAGYPRLAARVSDIAEQSSSRGGTPSSSAAVAMVVPGSFQHSIVIGVGTGKV